MLRKLSADMVPHPFNFDTAALRFSHPASMTSNALKRLQQVELFSKCPNENPMLELLGTSEPMAARAGQAL